MAPRSRPVHSYLDFGLFFNGDAADHLGPNQAQSFDILNLAYDTIRVAMPDTLFTPPHFLWQ